MKKVTFYHRDAAPKKKGGSLLKKLLFAALAVVAIGLGVYYCFGIFGEGGGGGGEPELEDIRDVDTKEVLEVTPENSPGNPKFIKVSFTEDEYKNSPTYSEKIIRDSMTVADFKKQGVRVSIDSYNLHHAEDEVKVQVLPKKQDPTFGNELYTYNVSLASGQSKFGTKVEVTLPIHNGKDALQNVLWHNLKTGEWEELFYTVAEDGKTCTAYIDHFSEISTEEMTMEEFKKMGYRLIDIYENGSVFVEMNKQGCGDRSLLPVGLIPTPPFEKIARRQTESAKGVYEALKNGGGIPTNAGLAESLDLYGRKVDKASTLLTVGQLAKIVGDNLPANMTGGALTFVGGAILAIRLLDMQRRGADPVKIIDENSWALIAYLFGSRGALAAIAGLETVPIICAVVCVGIYVMTNVSEMNEAYLNKVYPFGTPETIEEGAYHQYLTTPNTEVLEKLGVDSDVPLKGTGEGWADAIKAIFEANKGVLHAQELGEKVAELYKTYVSYFWEDLSAQEQREFWRKYVDHGAFEWYQQYKTGAPSPGLPSEEGEFGRLYDILNKSGNIKLFFGSISVEPMDDEGFANVWREIKFDDNHIRSMKKEYMRRAMEVVAKNTNKIIYKLIEDEQQNNILNARKLLRDEVLPLMNSTLYFYAKDMSLKKDEPFEHSIYYGYDSIAKKNDPKMVCKMEFIGSKRPRFEAYYYEGTFYCLSLVPDLRTVRLGKSNVFHYLQYGAPDSVDVIPAEGSPLKKIYGTVNFKDKQAYKIPTADEGIYEYGFRVPVEYNDKPQITELSKFTAFWLPEELMGKYTPSKWVLGLVYMEDDKEFAEYEGPGENYASWSRWVEIKYFDYNKQTGVLTIDFAKNNPGKGVGVATFYLDRNDRLVMKNSGGTCRFLRFTDETRKKNDELYVAEQKRKAEEREKQRQQKGDKKTYPLIPLGDTEY